MAKSKTKQLLLESFLVTLLVFVVVWLLFISLKISFKPLNFIAKSLKDVHLTDIYFSAIQVPKADTSVVIVNIGELDRSGIAFLTEKILQYKPRVLGMDVLFDASRKDEPGDSLLTKVLLNRDDKIVMGGFFNTHAFDFNPAYKQFDGLAIGHINLLTDSLRVNVVRHCQLWYEEQGRYCNSFALEVIRLADFSKYAIARARPEKIELIHFRGNRDAFRILNGNDMLSSDRNYQRQLTGKIVLMGFCGSGTFNDLDDLQDMFYSPLNDKLYGRSHPDMYGVVIHANIISMILDGNYIQEMSGWMAKTISFVLVWLHVIPFVYFFIRRHLWYHIAAKLIQLFSLVLIMMGVFYLLDVHCLMIELKYMFLGVFVSVDILYLYEAMAVMLYKSVGIRSIFIHHHEEKGMKT